MKSCVFVFIKIYTLIKGYTTLTANPGTNEDNPLNSMFHRASKTTNLLVLFLYIILYPHSLHLIGSLDFISFSVWHSPQIYIIGCCFGGWTSFWVSMDSPWNHRLKYWITQRDSSQIQLSQNSHFSEGNLKRSQFLTCAFSNPMGRAKGRNKNATFCALSLKPDTVTTFHTYCFIITFTTILEVLPLLYRWRNPAL